MTQGAAGTWWFLRLRGAGPLALLLVLGCVGPPTGAAVRMGAAPATEDVAGAAPAGAPTIGTPTTGALGAPCPARPVLDDLHAALWLLERTDDRAAARERIDRAQREIDRDQDLNRDQKPGDDGPSPWSAFAAALGKAADRPGGIAYAEVEELRARLHESPCLRPEDHRAFHRQLDDPLGIGPPP